MKSRPVSSNFQTGPALLIIYQRIFVISALMLLMHQSLGQILTMRDGGGYLHIAQGFLSRSFHAIPIEDTQYFPGYPFLISLLQRLLPSWAAVYLVQFLCLTGSLWLGRKLFPTADVMFWTLFCIPSSVLFTSLNMSESLFILLFLAMIYFYSRSVWLCSLAAGCALVTRPQGAVFLYLTLWVPFIQKKNLRGLLILLFVPALFIFGMLWFNFKTFGNPFHNFSLYASHESAEKFLTVPFGGYLNFTLDPHIRPINKVYIHGLTFFLMAGYFLFARKLQKEGGSECEKIFFGGSFLQLMFLFLLNSRWAFLELPRYFVPLFPAAFLGFKDYLPKNKWLVLAIGFLATAVAVYSEVSGNRYEF